jgi:hypothetical protein
MAHYVIDRGPILTKFVLYLAFNSMKQMLKYREHFSSIFDGINVDFIDKNGLSFIMGQIVAMETGITSTVSLRIF